MAQTHPHRSPRIGYSQTVSVYDGQLRYPAELCTLSETEAFLAMEQPLRVGQGVCFRVRLGSTELTLRGHVRWTRSLPAGPRHPVGCGLELFDPDGALAARLRVAIDRLREVR